MNRKFTYIYFVLSSLAAVAFRLFLLVFSTDIETGFIKDGYSTISIFMVSLIALAMGMVFIFGIKTKDINFSKENTYSTKNKIVSFLFAIAILFECIFSPIGKLLPFMQRQLDLISGVFAFAVLIWSAFEKELKFKIYPILKVVPLFFFILRLIAVFSVFSAFSMIVDIVFELVALCAMLVGFLFFSKCENFETATIKSPLYFGSLLFSAAIGFTASLPKILLSLRGHTEYIHINTSVYTIFFASLFLTLYSVERFKSE